MMKPDSKRHDPSSANVRRLIAATGLKQAEVAERLGVGLRTIERWASEGNMPYTAQYALEQIATKDEPIAPPAKRHPLAGVLGR